MGWIRFIVDKSSSHQFPDLDGATIEVQLFPNRGPVDEERLKEWATRLVNLVDKSELSYNDLVNENVRIRASIGGKLIIDTIANQPIREEPAS